MKWSAEDERATVARVMRWRAVLVLLVVSSVPACGGARGRPSLPPPEYEEPGAPVDAGASPVDAAPLPPAR